MDKADQIISNLFDNSAHSESRNLSNLFNKWKSIVQDERLSDHCRLEDIQGHSIRVSFDHPGWIQLFRMNQSSIINRLNNQYPGLNITSVSMHLRDDKFVPVKKKAVKEEEREPVISVKKEPMVRLSDIKDEDLRNILKNLKDTLQGKK